MTSVVITPSPSAVLPIHYIVVSYRLSKGGLHGCASHYFLNGKTPIVRIHNNMSRRQESVHLQWSEKTF